MNTVVAKIKPEKQRQFFKTQFGKIQETPPRTGKIVRYFPNSDLRGQHKGLAEIAKANRIDVNKLAPGEYLIFVNNARDKLKMYAAGNVIAYLRMPQGRRIDLRVIQYLPRFFTGGKINYTAALTKSIDRSLKALKLK